MRQAVSMLACVALVAMAQPVFSIDPPSSIAPGVSKAGSLHPRDDETITVNEAIVRIDAQYQYLSIRFTKEFEIDVRRTLQEVYARHGLSDSEQAVLLQGPASGGNAWATYGARIGALYGGMWLWMGRDFYGHNTVPIAASLRKLRAKDSPTRIARADMEAMDRRMRQFLVAEPAVRKLMEQALELHGDQAALEMKLVRAAEEDTKLGVVFGYYSYGNTSPVQNLALSREQTASKRFLRDHTQHHWQAADLARQIDDLGHRADAIVAQYKAMKAVYTAELGAQDPPAPPPVSDEPVRRFPSDAVAD
jgi:hypothetical protein